jgi:phage baseplate assembly protein gpV
MDNLIQIGEINSVNYAARTVKVLHSDAGNSVSTDLPLMRPKLRPEVGDSVACIYLSNGAAYGICLSGFYQDENTPADNGEIIEIAVLPDGASIQYDTTTKTLILNAEHVVINNKDFIQHTHSDPQGGQTGSVT